MNLKATSFLAAGMMLTAASAHAEVTWNKVNPASQAYSPDTICRMRIPPAGVSLGVSPQSKLIGSIPRGSKRCIGVIYGTRLEGDVDVEVLSPTDPGGLKWVRGNTIPRQNWFAGGQINGMVLPLCRFSGVTAR